MITKTNKMKNFITMAFFGCALQILSIQSYVSPKTVNVQMSIPLVLLWDGYIGVEYKIDFKISKRLTVGPTITYVIPIMLPHSYFSSISLQMNYMPGEQDIMKDSGWYVNTFYKYRFSDKFFEVKNSLMKIGAMFGYQWMFKSGFNIK